MAQIQHQQPLESNVSSSRIFIRNVPPSVTETSFRTHFAHPNASTLTDSRFFPNRRIGYVGYKTPQDAQNAVKYFDKTFIGMARIRVEIAHAYVDGKQKQVYDEDPRGFKRKRDDGKENLGHQNDQKVEKLAKKGPKLNEFLQVMGSSKREQTWKDTETEAQPQQGQQKTIKTNEENNDDEMDQDNETLIPRNDQNQSDDAWLRSRSSKLLETLDDSDNQTHTQTKQFEHEDVEGDEPTKDEDRDLGNPTAEDKIRLSSRLYLRNLPFKVTEDELRDHFSTYGQLVEVRYTILFTILLIFHDEPDRDI
jgi:multiple RNA-binding domain-containing protein 1